MGVCIDYKLNINCQHNIIAKKLIAYCNILTGVSYTSDGKCHTHVIPLFLALTKPYQKYCIQFWAPKSKKAVDKLERVQRKAIKIVRGTKDITYGKRLEH